MKSWESLLSYTELTGSYRSVPSLQNYFFTQSFYKSPRPVYGDTVEMIEISATNSPGPMNTKGGSARMIQPKGGGKRVFSLFNYFTEMTIDPNALMFLRSFDNPQLQSKGQEVVDLQLEESATRQRLAKEVILSSIMCFNRVNIKANGDILIPSVHATTGAITDHADAQISADFGVPDDHRGNLGGIIGAQWSTASTSIMDHLENVRRQAAIDGAPDIADIYVNAIHKADLRANTEFNDWAKYTNTAGYSQQVLSNFDSDMLTVFGKRFHFIAGTWVDASGTTRDIMPENLALMLPDQGPWLRAFTGYTNVPKDVGIASAASPLEDFEPKPGEYAYAFTNHNPVRTSIFAGDTYGLGFANPNAIWVAKVFT
jgi:hypothetical protein